ncbi:MAG: hypothetical protein KBD53_04040 [Candidatus Omnitrophica bacterium]|nr:hypothetical protein [Candidatus Omnitrophota bacterium]
MGDKALLVLLIIFVIVGTFTYDQYVTEKTGKSPIAELLDSNGLSQYIDPNKSKVSKFATFPQAAEFHLSQLFNKLTEFKDQRQALIQKRVDLIYRLIGLQDRILKTVELYTEDIKKERDESSTYQLQLDELGKLWAKTYLTNNYNIRQKKFEEIKEKISLLREGKDWGIAQKDIDALTEFIDQTFVQKNLTSINGCQTDAVCLEANVKQTQAFLNEVLIDFQQQSTPKFIHAVKIIQKSREFNLGQVALSDENEAVIDQQDHYFHGKYAELVQRLTKITPRDLNDLIQLNQELQMDDKAMMDSIQDQSRRLSQRIEGEERQMNGLILKLEKNKLAAFSDFFSALQEIRAEKQSNLAELADIDQQLIQLFRHRSFEYKSSLRNIAALLEVDLQRLVEDRKYAYNLNANYPRFRAELEERRRMTGIKNIYQDIEKQQAAASPKPEDISKDLKQAAPIIEPLKANTVTAQPPVNQPDLKQQKIRQENTLSDFNKARNKAKANGL